MTTLSTILATTAESSSEASNLVTNLAILVLSGFVGYAVIS